MSADASSLFPKPLGDDPEDVAWALSTAEALWKRGEYADAVSWIRKAAAAASEADADSRVIELAKAAAELATLVAVASASEAPPAMPPEDVAPPSMEALSADALEVDVDVTTSIEPAPPAPNVDKPKAPPPKPRGPPPRVRIESNESTDTSVVTSAPAVQPAPDFLEAIPPPRPASEPPKQSPVPNPAPSPLQPLVASELEVHVFDDPVQEEVVAPTSVRAIDSRFPIAATSTDSDSGPRMPTVPPSPPDVATSSLKLHAQTPMPGPAVSARREGRLITAIAMAPAIDVRAKNRDAVGLGAPIDVRTREPSGAGPLPSAKESSGVGRIPIDTQGGSADLLSARRPTGNEPSGVGRIPIAKEPSGAQMLPTPSLADSAISTSPIAPHTQAGPPAPRLKTIRSHAPAPSSIPAPRLSPSVPAPRNVPGSIPPPSRPISVRPPAPPEKPLELDLRDSKVNEDEMSATQQGLAPARMPAMHETHQGIAPSTSTAQKLPPPMSESTHEASANAADTTPGVAAISQERAATVLETQQGIAPSSDRPPESVPSTMALTNRADPQRRSLTPFYGIKAASQVDVPAAPGRSFDALSQQPAQKVAAASVPAPAKGAPIDPSRFEALADVPDEERDAIVASGEVLALLPDEETAAPPLVLVLHGELEVRTKGRPATLEIVPADQVRLFHPIAPADGELVVVGGRKGARMLSLSVEALEQLRAAAPWVVQDLEAPCDDLHVVAGALRGEIGRRLDDSVLTAILGRAETMRLAPGTIVVKHGELVRALVVLGSGALSLRVSDAPDADEIGAIEQGEVVFPAELLSRGKAPATVRAGAEGALVLVATRGATEELLVTYPPLLEILGGS